MTANTTSQKNKTKERDIRQEYPRFLFVFFSSNTKPLIVTTCIAYLPLRAEGFILCLDKKRNKIDFFADL
jgi:hypothetical protein